jgi:hypothetical protein
VSPPAIVIRIELERLAPIVRKDCLTEGDEASLALWLALRPELHQLLADALDLAQRADGERQ